jgi:hypothetical protein
VSVSNQREIVQTDESGRWTLPVDDDTIFFVIKPRDWMTPVNKDQLPQFYYIHKPNGSPADYRYAGVAPTGPLPASIDFALSPSKENDQFKAIFFGDPQPSTIEQVNYIAHDVIAELVGTDAAFGVTLGDIMFDKLELFEPSNANVALIESSYVQILIFTLRLSSSALQQAPLCPSVAAPRAPSLVGPWAPSRQRRSSSSAPPQASYRPR